MQPRSLAEVTRALIDAGRLLHARGWAPATSGNLSARLTAERVAITASGSHKGRLDEGGILVVDLDGKPLDGIGTPSAETPLHMALYKRDPAAGAVIHTHSVHATVLSRLHRGPLVLSGYELLKGLAGVRTHEVQLALPILPNDQDTAALAQAAMAALAAGSSPPGYLIAGHGLYTWGKSIGDALRHVEALEFLLECELAERKWRSP